MAALLRKWSLIATTEAGSGHPTSCMSAADLVAVLFDSFFSYDLDNPKHPNNDRFVLSKGHAAPLFYAAFAVSGALPLEELKTLRKFGSPLEGHPTPHFPYTEAATGSLGQGLCVGVGLALSGKKDKRQFRTYVILGDGELAEGSIWEAANFASYYKLDNLIVIADINRFGQSQETMFAYKLSEYEKRFSAFGWKTVVIDGHSTAQIERALRRAVLNKSGEPFVIIAKTKKGKGVSFLEDRDGWHGKALKKEELAKALKELGEVDDNLRFSLKLPPAAGPVSLHPHPTSSVASLPAGARWGSPALATRLSASYKNGEEIATREVYGEVLAQLANTNPLIYALDGDVKNSTFSEAFKKHHPDRFIECFIAEQNMVGVAIGMSRLGKIPFASTFAAFFTRAFDQIRMAAISRANIKFVGSHAGVSIGEDGPSQMALEDIAMFGAIPQSVIFHPSDAVSSAKLLPLMVAHAGISYLRTLRPKTPIIYDMDEEFRIGGSKILRKSSKDVLTIVAVGITVHEALRAYEILKREGIIVRVVDCYSVKPIDGNTLKQCSNETIKQCVITVEDHYEHGGLGDVVLSAMADVKSAAHVEKMAVREISRSGTKDELLDFAGISAKQIVAKVKSLCRI